MTPDPLNDHASVGDALIFLFLGIGYLLWFVCMLALGLAAGAIVLTILAALV